MVDLILLYVHVLAAVFLVGFGLYGAILTLAGADGALLERAFRSPWPPRGLPSPVRLPVTGLGGGALLVAALSGFALLASKHGAGTSDYAVKLALVGAVLVLQLALALRPRGAVLLLHFLALLSVVAVAALLSR